MTEGKHVGASHNMNSMALACHISQAALIDKLAEIIITEHCQEYLSGRGKKSTLLLVSYLLPYIVPDPHTSISYDITYTFVSTKRKPNATFTKDSPLQNKKKSIFLYLQLLKTAQLCRKHMGLVILVIRQV